MCFTSYDGVCIMNPETMMSTDTTGKPRTRQRAYKPPPTLDVPDIDKDAAERKRVLNVLAQRRYRDKKRQSKKAASRNTADSHGEVPSESTATAVDEMVDEDFSRFANQGNTFSGDGLGMDSWDALDDPALSSVLSSESATGPDFFATTSTSSVDASMGMFDFLHPSNFTPGVSSQSLIVGGQSSGSASSPSSIHSLGDSWQGWPDSYLLPVHELILIKAMLRIATRIGCSKDQLWGLDAVSPFYRGPPSLSSTPSTASPAPTSPSLELIPSNLHPTQPQVSMPHHPMFDLLPWPSVRNKIIGVMSVPDDCRPGGPHTAGSLALVNFAYDLEDQSEGVRIYGEDPYDPEAWEVGQVFFERWWFLFDRGIVETSNRWRSLRGAPPLMIR